MYISWATPSFPVTEILGSHEYHGHCPSLRHLHWYKLSSIKPSRVFSRFSGDFWSNCVSEYTIGFSFWSTISSICCLVNSWQADSWQSHSDWHSDSWVLANCLTNPLVCSTIPCAWRVIGDVKYPANSLFFGSVLYYSSCEVCPIITLNFLWKGECTKLLFEASYHVFPAHWCKLSCRGETRDNFHSYQNKFFHIW